MIKPARVVRTHWLERVIPVVLLETACPVVLRMLFLFYPMIANGPERSIQLGSGAHALSCSDHVVCSHRRSSSRVRGFLLLRV
jgi:hypothetical protein